MIFELREFLSDHVYTCFFTNFYFEHNGQRLSDYLELAQLDLKTNRRIFMKPERYDDRTGRAHVKKLINVLEVPPVLTMNVAGADDQLEVETETKEAARRRSSVAEAEQVAVKNAANAQDGQEESKEP